ncbi:MAG: hypothetical protein JXA21_16975, partial [Anaerolineae bacterium]|nr:hypothetical protein [Anaerolineae bacterium]
AALTFAAPEPPLDSQALPDTVSFATEAARPARQAAPQLPDPQPPIALPEPVWRIGVTQDGVYTLDYATLAAAGVPVAGMNPTNFHLFWRGQEVAMLETGDLDAIFEPGDAWVFYGEKYHGSEQDERFTDENVYWLAVYNDQPGLRMATRDVTPTSAPQGVCTGTAVAEQNLVYWARGSDHPGSDAVWFWDEANSPNTVTRTYPITLSAPTGAGELILEVEVASFNYNDTVNPDHHVRLYINNHALGDFYWDGKTGHRIVTGIPDGKMVASGANTLTIAYVTDVGHQDVYFDKATLTYRRNATAVNGAVVCEAAQSGPATYLFSGLPLTAQFFDVGDPLHPVALTGVESGEANTLVFSDGTPAGSRYRAEVPRPITLASYAPANDLIAPDAGADELILAPRSFLAALAPLVEHRQNQGLRVKLIAVEDVYPIFGGGVFHPEAIRSLVAHARAHWPGAPLQYLFLVGDGNFNFKGYNPAGYGAFVPTLIPPYLEFADPSQGDVPVDARFGDVNGDGLSDVIVGRLPAQTVTEVSAYVAKLVAYEAQPAAPWQLQALMVADNGQSYDEGFDTMLDNLGDLLPDTIVSRTVYMEDLCVGYSSCPSATQALTTEWNAGALLLTYAGHGSIHRWAHEPLLINKQLAALDQTTALPFLLSLDCWDGYWMFPPTYPKLPGQDVRSIGEWASTVLTQTGAMAAFGPAGLAYAHEEEMLATALYQQLFNNGVLRVGLLTQAGRAVIATSYMARTYTLLGDPAAVLALEDSVSLAPLAAWHEVVVVHSTTDLNARIAAQLSTRFGETFDQPVWAADRGSLNGGMYTAPDTPGVVYLSAQLGSQLVPLTLTVVAGPPAALVVTPDPLAILLDQSAPLTATFVDNWGNPTVATATFTWETDLGVVEASGVDAGSIFTAPGTPGEGWITATATITEPAPLVLSEAIRVYVLASEPVAVGVTPPSTQVNVGGTAAFTATLLDALDNPLDAGATASWQTDVGSITANGDLLAAIHPGTGHVTATLSFNLGGEPRALHGNAAVTVTAGPAVTLTLAPGAVEVAVSDAVQMTATPRDLYGNPTGSASAITWTASLGTIAANGVFTAPAHPGHGNITAVALVAQESGAITLTRSAPVNVWAKVYLPLVLRAYSQ